MSPTVCSPTDNGAVDAYGDGCAGWSGYIYGWGCSGYYDDSDFSAVDMCCGCGGGIIPPTPAPSLAPTLSADAAWYAGSPFFSQFQEASSGSGNKYYQIYNPTDAPIDLANDYSIAWCKNGCGEGPTFDKGQLFASGAVLSLIHI